MSRPIIFCINALRSGGAERLVIDEIHECERRDIEVWLITLLKEKVADTLSDQLIFPRERWIQFSIASPRDIRECIKLFLFLRRLRPQAIVTHLWIANTYARVIAWFARVPTIIAFEHNVYDTMKTKKQFFVDCVLQYLTTKIVAVSEGVKASLVRHGIVEERIKTILNALPPEKFERYDRSLARHRLGLKNDFYYLFIGRLVKVKQVSVLIDAFTKLATGQLLIVGDGAERKDLEARAAPLGDRVHFFGTRTDVSCFLAAADCMILPSSVEGLGIVILEAYAAHCPVIATAIPGVNEIVHTEETGLLVPVRDIDALTKAMMRIESDKVLRECLVKSADAFVQDFTISTQVDRLLSLIHFPSKLI